MKAGFVAAGFAVALFARPAAAQEGCVLDSVRVLVADGAESAFVEISARVTPRSGGASCSIDWSHVAIASPGGADAAPTLALAATFVDHKLVPPLVLAEGIAQANPREWRAELGTTAVVSARWIVEGTATGLRVEVPRATFPRLGNPGAKVERRIKSARAGTAKFGVLGELAIVPQAPGPAGGIGPTGPLDNERTILEFVPNGTAPGEPVPGPLLTLDALRGTLPARVLDLTPENKDGWDEVAKRAYAAAMHGDPVVASLGVHTLAWLGSGLSLQATKIAKTAGGNDTAVVPASVVDAIGDVQARLNKRFGATGHLLPLARSALFRKALAERPWADAAKAKAAKDAIARLATVQPQDLAPYLVPAIMDGATAPIDPPQAAAAIDPNAVVPMGLPASSLELPKGSTVDLAASRGEKRKRPWWALWTLVGLAIVGWTLREDFSA